jgi:putative FmdB family regulatory protein
MPIYEYEHVDTPCGWGSVFEIKQSMKDDPLTLCPNCSTPVRKLISRTSFSSPKTNSELKDLGFTKLVKRDTGIYENVTARDGESRIMRQDKPETYPDFSKTISD